MKTTDIDRRAEVLELAGRYMAAQIAYEGMEGMDFPHLWACAVECAEKSIINAVDEATAEKATSDSIVVREQVGWHSGEGIYGMGATPEPHWEPVYVLRPGATIEDKRDHEADFSAWWNDCETDSQIIDGTTYADGLAIWLAARGVKL